MNIGILIPGHSSDDNDWAIPVLRRFIARLAARHQVRVLALRYPHRRGRYRLEGADVIALGAGPVTGLRRAALWLDAQRTLYRLSLEQPFDLLHGMWADETGLLTMWAGRILAVPSVVSILGGELVGFDDIGYGLQRGFWSPWIVSRALAADAVLSTCAYVDELLAHNQHGAAQERDHRVILGVDADEFTPGGDYDPRRLIHVGSLIGVKDQATILRALVLLPSDVTLDIIGDGPERAPLQALADALGVGARVRWLGRVPHPTLAAHYRSAAVHVMASLSETGPLSTLEAAACAVPTVGTAVGMLPDHPGLGAAVPVGHAEAMADAIRSLLDDPLRLAEARTQARRTAEQLNIDQMVAQAELVYRHSSNRCPGRRPSNSQPA